jgi:hypothetical protein
MRETSMSTQPQTNDDRPAIRGILLKIQQEAFNAGATDRSYTMPEETVERLQALITRRIVAELEKLYNIQTNDSVLIFKNIRERLAHYKEK